MHMVKMSYCENLEYSRTMKGAERNVKDVDKMMEVWTVRSQQ